MTEPDRSKKLPWRKAYLALFIVLIASLPFSYQPLIHLDASDGANYDLSLIYVVMLALVVVSLPAIWQNNSTLLRKKYNLLILAFFLWNVLSTLWSANALRGILTSGLIGLGVLVFLSIQVYGATLIQYKRTLLTTLKIITLAIGVFCLYQLFGDALGLSGHYTLLPPQYMSQVFGFARITGFSAEPEFLGSLLLLPLGVFLYLEIKKNHASDLLLTALCALLITLTLSRGALIGAIIVVAMMLVLCRSQLNIRRFTLIIISGFVGIALGIGLFSLAAGLNTRDDISAHQAFAKAVNQVSLGVINIHENQPATPPTKSAASEKSIPDNAGYVASSTTSRLQMSREAIGLLSDQPRRAIYGIGLGSFGVSLHQKSALFSESSIVNNHYLEILTELGLIGLALFVGFFYTLFRQLVHQKQYIFIPIIIGILVQWLFFSGYPNILHLWPIIGLAIVFVPKSYLSRAR